jgi:hypothetical protein
VGKARLEELFLEQNQAGLSFYASEHLLPFKLKILKNI